MDDQLANEMSHLSVGIPDAGPPAIFRFLDLPSEIRIKIYSLVLFGSKEKRIRRKAQQAAQPFPLQRIGILLACRQFHAEASQLLYSSLQFRIFPLQDYSREPSVVDIPLSYKRCIRSLRLSLGSSWTRPPRSWRVNRKLGLQKMDRVHTLDIFIQCDPSHPVFEGFRVSKGFYTQFAGALLDDILKTLPGLTWVRFDGNPSVDKDGDLMTRLLNEVRKSGKIILWGPERCWRD